MNSVASVATTRPPITARPSGAFCSPASPRPSAIGTMPMIIASAVISTGRRRILPASITASNAVDVAARAQVVGEADHQDRVRHRNADRHDRAHQRFDVDRRAGERQHPDDADQAAGHRHHDDERIDPGLEQDHQQRIDQDHRQDHAEAEAAERRLHHLVLAADVDMGGDRQALADVVDRRLDVGGGRRRGRGRRHWRRCRARAARCSGSPIPGWSADRRCAMSPSRMTGAAGQRPPDRRRSSGVGVLDRRVQQIVDRIDPVDRRLHRHRVVHVVLRIEEEVRRHQHRGRQRGQHVVGDVALRDAQLRGAQPVDVDLQRRDSSAPARDARRRRPGSSSSAAAAAAPGHRSGRSSRPGSARRSAPADRNSAPG